jgi:hypothetical protein
MWLDHSLNPFVDMSVYYHGKAAVDLADLESEPCWLGFADGGHVSGPGTATSDSIFARVSNGEFIVNAAAASKHGKLLEAINSGKVPRFADGGIVGGGLVASIANLAQAAVTGQNGQGPVNNNQRTVNQTVNLHAKDTDGMRRSAAQVAAALSHATAQAAARWR